MSYSQSVQQVFSSGRRQNAQGRSYRLEITVPYGTSDAVGSRALRRRGAEGPRASGQGPEAHTIFFAQFWGQGIHSRRHQLSRPARFS